MMMVAAAKRSTTKLPRKGLVYKSRARDVVLEPSRVDRNVKIIRELPQAQDERVKNILRRNETLRANQYYNARLERERTLAAFNRAPARQQQNLIRAYLGTLEDRMHKLAKGGLIPMDLAPS